MSSALTVTRTTIGQKAIVAVTGVILFGFVIGHLAGNLILFAGPEAYNEYAATLKGNLPLLWSVRSVLLLSVVLHVVFTVSLARRNVHARSVPYKKPREDLVTTYAARTMVISGPIVFLFIVFHIAHYTAPGLSIGGHFDPDNVYQNVLHGFRTWWVSAIYIFANFLLGLHLYHGGWSALQSVGANHPRYNVWRKRGALIFACFVAGGNIGIPIAVMTRVIDEDGALQIAPSYEDEAD
jgi:succinate dehydrogenase / fumarate reductase, cytochrome b subunit